jgi:hypothetical protein
MWSGPDGLVAGSASSMIRTRGRDRMIPPGAGILPLQVVTRLTESRYEPPAVDAGRSPATPMVVGTVTELVDVIHRSGVSGVSRWLYWNAPEGVIPVRTIQRMSSALSVVVACTALGLPAAATATELQYAQGR